jgi:hypothetical protein
MNKINLAVVIAMFVSQAFAMEGSQVPSYPGESEIVNRVVTPEVITGLRSAVTQPGGSVLDRLRTLISDQQAQICGESTQASKRCFAAVSRTITLMFSDMATCTFRVGSRAPDAAMVSCVAGRRGVAIDNGKALPTRNPE